MSTAAAVPVPGSTSGPASGSTPAAASGSARRTLLWVLATALTVLVGALLPLLGNPRFYFADDTQTGAFGIWYELGSRLRDGSVTFLDPSRWQAGNVLAEGQWGVFNPLVLLIGLAATTATDAVVFSTVVKLAALVVAGVGTYALARSYGARSELAYLAGIAVPFGGFTTFMDAPSWVTGLFTFALLPGFWAALRRAARGANPLPAGVLGYLVVTVGYVHGTIALVLVALGVLLEAWLGRRSPHGLGAGPAPALRVLGLGALLGLVAVTVYLPGVLAADVTVRDSEEIQNSNFLTGDLSGLVAGVVPLTQPQVEGWWGEVATVPLLRLSWVVPLAAYLHGRRLAASWRGLAALAVVGLGALAFVLGPSDLGPLRFPARMHPYVVLTVVVLVTVGLSTASVSRPSGRRLVAAVGAVLLGGYLGWAEVPEHRTIVAVGTAVTMAGVVAAWWALGGRPRRRAASGAGVLSRRRPVALAGIGAVMVLLVGLAQQHWFARSWLPDFGLPAAVAAYERPLADALEGDVIVVGVPTEATVPGPPGLQRTPEDTVDPDVWQDTLLANTWYLNDASVQNVYTPLSYRDYAYRLCMNWRGETCPNAVGTLFTPLEAAGTPHLLVDLLGVSHVQVVLGSYDVEPAVPEGWHIADRTPTTMLWSRDQPVAPAGGVVATTPGLAVTETRRSATALDVRVDSAEGGTVVLSRLAWPGYTASGATLAEPLDGYLLTLEVPAGESGRTVHVEFEPAGWAVGRLTLVAALGGLLVWSLAAAVAAVRRGAGNGPPRPRDTRGGRSQEVPQSASSPAGATTGPGVT